jgi:hypothetical protein
MRTAPTSLVGGVGTVGCGCGRGLAGAVEERGEEGNGTVRVEPFVASASR